MRNEVNYNTTNREGNEVEYDVPVIRKEMKGNEASMSMKDKIKSAGSQAEIEALLQKAISSYKYASTNTISKWKKAAKVRLEGLGVKVKSESPAVVKTKKAPQRKLKKK